MTTDIYVTTKPETKIKFRFEVLTSIWTMVFHSNVITGWLSVNMTQEQLIEIHEQLSKIREEHGF
jgi:hypothetical protein